MKQVPEGTPVIGAEEQLESLRQELMGNQAFAACRGRLDQSFIGFTDELIRDVTSPSVLLRRWDGFVGKARVMSNLLAKYQRDRWEVAFTELHKALVDKSHVILGETFPLEETEPVTILMLDPDRTMLMTRCIIEEEWSCLDLHLRWRDWAHSNHMGDSLITLTEISGAGKLLKVFPTLKQHLRERQFQGARIGSELENAYHDTVVNTFSKDVCNWLEEKCNRQGLAGNWQYNQDALALHTQQYLYIFKGEQSEVLGHFTREEQTRIGTWQFHAPKILNWGVVGVRIGIHPETLHPVWQKRQPALTSKGVSHGLGAIILTDLPGQGDLDYPTRNVLHASAKDPYGVIFS